MGSSSERPSELPATHEEMCQRAADAVMAAYRDGYTRQNVRLGIGQLEDQYLSLKATLPIATAFTTRLWEGNDLKGIKTSIIDGDVGTLLYREAERPPQDAAVLYLAGRELVTEPKVQTFFSAMGDRLVVLANTQEAPASWTVSASGRDFAFGSDEKVGKEVADMFKLQSFYLHKLSFNNWRLTYFRAYPGNWQVYMETLTYEMVKLGEFADKPSAEVVFRLLEEYEDKYSISPFSKVAKMLKDTFEKKATPDIPEARAGA